MAILSGKRELLAKALGNPLMRPISRALGSPGLLTLTYHRVTDYDTLDLNVVSASVEEFRWQAQYLKRTIRVLSGREVLDLVRGDLHLRDPALCITFDDGYADNLQAGRILREAGVPAIFFVTTGFVGTETITDWDRLAYATRRTERSHLDLPAIGKLPSRHLASTPRDLCARELRTMYFELEANEQGKFVDAVESAAGCAARDEARPHPPFMNWDEVRELRALGHTIGAHTHSHTILSKMTPEEQLKELQLSRQIIEREVGIAPELLAYPNGRTWTFTDTTKDLARQSGFLAAFSFYGGRIPPVGFDAYDLRRVWVSPTESRELFSARVSFPQLLA